MSSLSTRQTGEARDELDTSEKCRTCRKTLHTAASRKRGTCPACARGDAPKVAPAWKPPRRHPWRKPVLVAQKVESAKKPAPAKKPVDDMPEWVKAGIRRSVEARQHKSKARWRPLIDRICELLESGLSFADVCRTVFPDGSSSALGNVLHSTWPSLDDETREWAQRVRAAAVKGNGGMPIRSGSRKGSKKRRASAGRPKAVEEGATMTEACGPDPAPAEQLAPSSAAEPQPDPPSQAPANFLDRVGMIGWRLQHARQLAGIFCVSDLVYERADIEKLLAWIETGEVA